MIRPAVFVPLVLIAPAAAQEVTIQDGRFERRDGRVVVVLNVAADAAARRLAGRSDLRLRFEPVTDEVRRRVADTWEVPRQNLDERETLTVPFAGAADVAAWNAYWTAAERSVLFRRVAAPRVISDVCRLEVPADLRAAVAEDAPAGQPAAGGRRSVAADHWTVLEQPSDGPAPVTLADVRVVRDDFSGIAFAVEVRDGRPAGSGPATLVLTDTGSEFVATHPLPAGAKTRLAFDLPLGIGWDGFTLGVRAGDRSIAAQRHVAPEPARHGFFAGSGRTSRVEWIAGDSHYTIELAFRPEGTLAKTVLQRGEASLVPYRNYNNPKGPAAAGDSVAYVPDRDAPAATPQPPQPHRPRPAPARDLLAAYVVGKRHDSRFAPPLPERPLVEVRSADPRPFGRGVMLEIQAERADRPAASGRLEEPDADRPEGRHWAWVCEYETPNGRRVASDASTTAPLAIRGRVRQNMRLDVPREYLRGWTVYLVTYPADAEGADVPLTLVSGRLEREED